MSYDVSIKTKCCATCGRSDDVEVGNMTSNVGGMYALVMPGPYEGGGRYDGRGEPEPRGGLPGLSGLPVWIALPILREGMRQMCLRPDEMKQLEPPNGWTTVEEARRFVGWIIWVCEQNPDGVLTVSW